MAVTPGASEMSLGRRHNHCPVIWMLLLLPLVAAAPATPTEAAAATSTDRRRCAHKGIAELIRTSPVIVKALGARIFTNAELQLDVVEPTSAILITLTPETIYKGASLLKMANGRGDEALQMGAAGGGGVGGRGLASGSGGQLGSLSDGGSTAYQYEGQLNATLQPLRCFDANMLKMLPTELIAFGKLLPATASGNLGVGGVPRQLPHPQDVLHISINGLHRWTSQFENHIWKHLGWDDWSDFTLCSVTCGKGVQQRFRRCLLDNPLVDINMNINLANDEVVVEEEGEGMAEAVDGEEIDVYGLAKADEANNDVSAERATAAAAAAFNAVNNEVAAPADDDEELAPPTNDPLKSVTTATPSAWEATSNGNEQAGIESVSFVSNARNNQRVGSAEVGGRRTRASYLHKKKHKSSKSVALSTLLCEGYNIEQRNCNSFECSDDISDLLKFYKKLPLTEELPVFTTDSGIPGELSDLTTAGAMGTSSTPSNMGYVRSWRNTLNFTLMITLRAKNDTRSTANIFSIRNATHNLYLEACQDGLRLYLERDNTTEMLPVKFNLYDYRWHQVAISIQNGDFISIYVDCLWTNSFVVSKRLYTLPMDADVEIGRGFNGELQQLLVLPEHQERLQCSHKRTSINEVKRYIIDTFIEDYGSN